MKSKPLSPIQDRLNPWVAEYDLWFAWHPVKLIPIDDPTLPERWVWLCWVKRKKSPQSHSLGNFSYTMSFTIKDRYSYDYPPDEPTT